MGAESSFQVTYLIPLFIFPLSVAYAIVRYRLLDIDRILSSTVLYGAVTVSAVLLFYLLLAALSYAMGEGLNINDPSLMAIYLFLMVILLNPLRALTQRAIDRVFYRSRADYLRLLTSLSHDLTITPDLDRTMHLMDSCVENALSPQQFILFLYDDERDEFIPHSPRRHPDISLHPENPLVYALKQNPEPVWFPPGRAWPIGMESDSETLDRLGCRVFVPLRFDEQMIGFLALGTRQSGIPYASDDLEFLGTVASQSSLSVENARLFTFLQRSNVKLELAYDSTLEGWARALELRDLETEGHSQRVAEMTVRLAWALEMEVSSLEHVRRGALLHDIGKMGVPDNILLKPGPLTEAERKTMQQHPTFAHQMLSQIDFLGPSLDIPYCHHEKWDGSGYPRGLAGEDIPASARIFAIVDVWDALTSDRPYRKAFPPDQALQIIREETGIYFDPAVAPPFMEVIADELT